ncbi:MAG TPA: hypothetical protein VE439_09150 [Anaerolineae bacterium]|jgi:hypothetical protein|nr:hypothetical protein [Anaerolineae bacterium]
MARGNEDRESRGQVERVRLESALVSTRYKETGQVAPFAYVINVTLPRNIWDGVFFSWLSIKGHLQAFHGVHRMEVFASNIDDRVRAVFIVSWTYEEQLTAWLEDGYTVEEMLRKEGVVEDNIEVSLLRDFT